MASLRIALAVGEYDRTVGLISGRIKPQGMECTVLAMSNAWDRHQRMIRHEEFDVAELSMSSFLMAKERGQKLVALPVFPYRMFRHQFILVRRGHGIEKPQDLRGKRVGTPMYQTTTMLWVRGLLLHEYGIRPEEIDWVTELPELVPVAPAGVSITVSPEPVERLFGRGELDAIVLIEEVDEHWLADPEVGRLFPDFPAVEADYWRRTGIYPMMHAVVAKAELMAAHPWMARNLYQAFGESLEWSDQLERHPRVVNLAWANAYFESERQLFGGNPYTYGIAHNRASLEACVQYSHEQGLTRHRFTIEELFVPSLLDT